MTASSFNSVFGLFENNASTSEIHVYTDGACSGNPGPGGWGAVCLYQEKEHSLFGAEADTTNNRMEMLAAIEALKFIPTELTVQLYTDSQYLKNGMTVWLEGWKKRNWINSKKEPVKNKDLWEELDTLAQNRRIIWNWVKGHDGNTYNEKADMLARRGVIASQMK